jgi:GH24 family phage-related lysozyme (muramidase)
MKTSQTGIDLIKGFEGCRLTAYKDSAGVLTIGYGHTAGVKAGQTITQVQAESFLKDDLAKSEEKVANYDGVYHWNQNQFDALVSFAFNIGSIKELTADGSRSITTIAQKILLYNKADKKVNAGLTARRKKEQALFLKQVSTGTSAAQTSQAQSETAQDGHTQLNYKVGEVYKTTALPYLNIRTKKATQAADVIPSGTVIGKVENGASVKNQATARVGNAIWMYIGLDKKGREQWICADTGTKAYLS